MQGFGVCQYTVERAKEDEDNYLYSIKYPFGVTRLRKVAEHALEMLQSVIEFFAPVQSGSNEHVSCYTHCTSSMLLVYRWWRRKYSLFRLATATM